MRKLAYLSLNGRWLFAQQHSNDPFSCGRIGLQEVTALKSRYIDRNQRENRFYLVDQSDREPCVLQHTHHIRIAARGHAHLALRIAWNYFPSFRLKFKMKSSKIKLELYHFMKRI